MDVFDRAAVAAGRMSLATLDLLRVEFRRAQRLADYHHFKLNLYFALFYCFANLLIYTSESHKLANCK
jgi:hypothetical protein